MSYSEDTPIPTNSGSTTESVAPQFDAKSYLEHTLERNPNDLMTVRRIPESCAYRVNWYDRKVIGNSAIAGLSIRYIRKSRFLFCHLGADGNPVVTYPKRQ